MPASMLIDQPGSSFGILARHARRRAEEDLNLLIRRNAKKPKTETPAKMAKLHVELAAFAARGQSSCKPNLVTDRCTIHPLQNKLEVELELQFADHNDRRRVCAQGEEIASADLSLDHEAEIFEEALNRAVERCFEQYSSKGVGIPMGTRMRGRS